LLHPLYSHRSATASCKQGGTGTLTLLYNAASCWGLWFVLLPHTSVPWKEQFRCSSTTPSTGEGSEWGPKNTEYQILGIITQNQNQQFLSRGPLWRMRVYTVQ